jgi:hypothetical protein
MAEESSKTGDTLIDMFPLESIGAIRWNEEYALRLQALRGDLTRKAVAAKLLTIDTKMSPQYLHLIETSQVKLLPISQFIALCKVYDAPFSAVIPTIKISLPSLT